MAGFGSSWQELATEANVYVKPPELGRNLIQLSKSCIKVSKCELWYRLVICLEVHVITQQILFAEMNRFSGQISGKDGMKKACLETRNAINQLSSSLLLLLLCMNAYLSQTRSGHHRE